MKTTWGATPFLLSLALLGGCSAESLTRIGGGDYAHDDDDSLAGDDDDLAGEPGATDDDGEGLPDEHEDDFLTSEPRGTDVYVFVPNPDRDTVSRINAETREIHTIEVGDEPTMVVVSSDYERAVSFNAGEDSVSIIDVDTSDVVTLAVREDYNTIQISPDGRWVVAWFDAAAEDASFDVGGVRSFTEVSFVDTVHRTVESYSVGFNPKEIKFTAGSTRAVIVSDSFLTVADLYATPHITLDLLDLDADPIDPPVSAEVAVPPAGDYAFVRYYGRDDVQVVDLHQGDLLDVPTGLEPTDLDLTPDGEQVIVVARGSNELYVLDALSPFDVEPEVIPTPATSTLGSLVLSPDGTRGLLFSTSALEDRVTIWDRVEGTLTERPLVKPVQSVAISPDGGSALIIHTLADALEEDDLFTNAWALTVVDLNTWLTNPVALSARPLSWTTSNDGRYSMFILENDRNVGIIDYATRLVDDVLVPSVPVHIGMMPLETAPQDALGWVSQAHELGRISFVRPYDLSVQTVTGFELNSDIE